MKKQLGLKQFHDKMLWFRNIPLPTKYYSLLLQNLYRFLHSHSSQTNVKGQYCFAQNLLTFARIMICSTLWIQEE